MPNKNYKELDHADSALRLSTPVGMEDGVKQLIIRHCGFELYNTRPYHNYETWSDGYIIMGTRNGKSTSINWLLEQREKMPKERDENFVLVSAEDLDEAAIKFAKALGKEEEIKKRIDAISNQKTNRALKLRKKFNETL